MSEFNDKPIKSPREDKFGFKALAKAIAGSISKMTKPEGTVIAINGPWGSGKSSLINLVRHQLDKSRKQAPLKIVDFKCWWFRGEEALTIAFFHELCSSMDSSEEDTKKAVSEFGAQLLVKASPLIGATTNMLMPGAGQVASGLTEFTASIVRLLSQDKTVEKLHEELCNKLQKSSKRYLIIIDDIDRLSPDEAILIFRLVKSVGGLPNVMYLLAYDRQLAEKIVSERYPSEGPHYLEKIVQASFELPEPGRVSLANEFLRRLDSVIEERGFRDSDHFRNLFDEIIAPEIKTPRDLIRILNPLKVTWSGVKGEVNVTDFLCIETLRVKRLGLYYALRSNKNALTKTGSQEEAMERGFHSSSPSKEPSTQPYKHPQAQTYEDIFLNREPAAERERLRRGLMLLFPALARTWSPSNYKDDDPDTWGRQRRVCSPRHFDTYFRFSLQDDVLSSGEIKELIAGTGNPEFIRQSLLDASRRKLSNGDIRASLLLDELKLHADKTANNDVRGLLKAVYSIADALIIEGEEIFKSNNTMRRLDYLTEALTMERFSLEERSDILFDACQKVSLTYLMRVAQWTYAQHFPQNNARSNLMHFNLTTHDHACKLKNMAIARIREAAVDGSLNDVPYLGDVLLWWIKVADDERLIRSWADNVFENNFAVARLAKAFISMDSYHDPQESLEDYWEEKLGHVVELGEFRSRAGRALHDENLEKEDRDVLKNFLNEF